MPDEEYIKNFPAVPSLPGMSDRQADQMIAAFTGTHNQSAASDTMADLNAIADRLREAKEKKAVDPDHYAKDNNQWYVGDFIWSQELDFYDGNVVKYIARAGKKFETSALVDLKKALNYLNRKVYLLKQYNELMAGQTNCRKNTADFKIMDRQHLDEIQKFVEKQQFNRYLAFTVKYICMAGQSSLGAKSTVLDDLERAAVFLSNYINSIEANEMFNQQMVKENSDDSR